MLDRRAFVCGILATVFTGPLVSEAQRPTRVYRIGFLALVD